MTAEAFHAHLKTGTTTICRAWSITRRDGKVLGFTDHDRDLAWEGTVFRASSGMTARALEQTTGLAVDNTEAVGALSDPSLREEDIRAGLFDGAEVKSWLVNWQDVAARKLTFSGTLGEIELEGKAFRAELRGLAEQLNRPQGRVYQKACTAILGDDRCGFDLSQPGYSVEAVIAEMIEETRLVLVCPETFADGWFLRGRLRVITGARAGHIAVVKSDAAEAGARQVEVWEALGSALAVGDTVRLEAGCDKRLETCRLKFANVMNYQGFPDIPGEDWLVAYPSSGGRNDGGSLRR